MSDDFVDLPLKKQINRQNPISRLERLERKAGARASAKAVQLSQISGQTGDLVVDGSIKVINPADGLADITIDDNGITIRNQEGAIDFETTSGSVEDVGIYIDGDDWLVLSNAVGDKGIRVFVDDAAHNVTQIDLRSEGVMFHDTTSRIYYGSSTNTPMLDFGTYSPTVTAVTNLDSATADGDWGYIRAGNIVTGGGGLTLDPTAGTGTTRVEISLPISSDFTATQDAWGGGSAQVTNTTGNIAADTADNRLALQFQSPTTGSMAWRVWFFYIVK